MNIGINEKDRIEIAEGLKRLLADSYTLYLQSHNYLSESVLTNILL